MLPQKNNYFLTTEDFKFIYSYFEKEGDAIVRLIHLFRIWQDNSPSFLINGKQLTQSGVKELVDNNFSNPPKINLADDALWAVLYWKDRNFMISLHKYFKPKGFDLMDSFSKWMTTKPSQKIWVLMPSYLFYLQQNGSDHIPTPEDIFKAISWITEEKRKYTCPFTVSLLHYVSKHPETYDYKKVVELFVHFTKVQQSIPKSQIKKYEEIIDNLERLNKPYWDSVAQNTPELQHRLIKRSTSTYEMSEYLGRKWIYDLHNLSVKNGNFNVRVAKENFDKFFTELRDEIVSDNNVLEFTYINNEAIITITVHVANSLVGKDTLDCLQTLLDLLFDHSRESTRLIPTEIKRIWQNINLHKHLDKNLRMNEKNSRKINKI